MKDFLKFNLQCALRMHLWSTWENTTDTSEILWQRRTCSKCGKIDARRVI